jgi:pyruvate dehydrogenase E1 component
MNENYEHPAMPEGAREGILRGMYLLGEAKDPERPRVQLMGSGTILREVMAAAELLRVDFGMDADVWSVTSFNELRRDGLDADRWNMLHPDEPQRRSYVQQMLEGRPGPAVAATDYVKAYAGQIRSFVPGHYRVLGTDGFGRSDGRYFFEVNRHFVVVAALKALADSGMASPSLVRQAIEKYKIDTSKPNPATI